MSQDLPTDICEIANLVVCMKVGHDPLLLRGETSRMQLVHTDSGVHFANIRLCKRCGLTYWEPQAPEESQVTP